jgi:zona occludens toxin (predicted ATPase)
MYRIIIGVPGSGKTYYAVNYLKKFITYDKLYNTLILDKDVLLITNIDDIKVQHIKYEDWEEAGCMKIENARKYLNDRKFKRAVMIIDEAQRFFSNMKDNEKFFFFEYHRHLGFDVFIIVQTLAAIPRRMTELAEYVIEALPRTYAIMGFRYKMLDSKTGMNLFNKVIKVDKDVFRVYKSFEMDESEKPKKVILFKWVSFVGLLVGVVAFGMIGAKSGLFFQELNNGKKQKTEVIQAKRVPQETNKNQTATETAAPAEKLPDMIFIPGHSSKQKPAGDIKGISKTEKGTYYILK